MTAERRSIPSILRYGARLLRLRDLWDKLLHIGACAVLLWSRPGPVRADASGPALCLAGTFFLLIGGYAINDVADFRQDRIAGEGLRRLPPRRNHSLAAAIAALTVGMLLVLVSSNGAAARLIASGTILLGLGYSLPPPRFKEHGLWGILMGALTQRPALFLVLAATLGVWDRLVVVLTLWLFFVGMTGMLGHQVLDRGRDRAGCIRTYVFREGPRPALRLGAVCAIAAVVAAISPLVLMPFAQAWPVVAVLAAMSSISVWKGLAASRRIGPLDVA